MYIRRLIYNPFAPYIFSILLGFGLATFFRKICNGRNCLKFRAPPLKKINNRIFKYGGKCYKYNLQAHPCAKERTIVNFA